jgi:hypothetical protein
MCLGLTCGLFQLGLVRDTKLLQHFGVHILQHTSHLHTSARLARDANMVFFFFTRSLA